MKYQVYLNKATSEAINAIAKDTKMTPNHYIKVLIEGIVQKAKEFAQESFNLDIEEAIKNGNIETTKTASKH
jgi:predicted DNA-binding protein